MRGPGEGCAGREARPVRPRPPSSPLRSARRWPIRPRTAGTDRIALYAACRTEVRAPRRRHWPTHLTLRGSTLRPASLRTSPRFIQRSRPRGQNRRRRLLADNPLSKYADVVGHRRQVSMSRTRCSSATVFTTISRNVTLFITQSVVMVKQLPFTEYVTSARRYVRVYNVIVNKQVYSKINFNIIETYRQVECLSAVNKLYHQ